MPSHTISQQVTAGGVVLTAQQTVTDNEEIVLGNVFAPATVNAETDIAITRASIKSLVIQATGGDLTIKTNSSGAPADTLVMTAGQVLLWSSVASIGTNPFATADITKFFFSSTAGCTFTLRAIVHSTNP
jgi:hypothetical protein